MELFGYLTFIGDLQEIPTQNGLNGSKSFAVREICVHSFVTYAKNGETEPYVRGYTLRVTDRTARNFEIEVGKPIVAECSSTARPYVDKEGKKRANGNIMCNRIVEIKESDMEQIQQIIYDFANVKNNS